MITRVPKWHRGSASRFAGHVLRHNFEGDFRVIMERLGAGGSIDVFAEHPLDVTITRRCAGRVMPYTLREMATLSVIGE